MQKYTALALLLMSGLSVATPPQLVGDYRFAGGLQSTSGGAPDLTLINTGTAFVTETVYHTSQTVLTFPRGSGVALVGTDQIMSTDVYTIVLTARITDPSGYRKLIDYHNALSDEGLYDNGGTLEFYSYGGGSQNVVGARYADIAVTRDSNGTIVGYFNGALQFTFADSTFHYGVIDAANTLRFFVDDTVGGGVEDSAGAVARIRIYNYVLDATEVRNLTDDIFADDFGS